MDPYRHSARPAAARVKCDGDSACYGDVSHVVDNRARPGPDFLSMCEPCAAKYKRRGWCALRLPDTSRR